MLNQILKTTVMLLLRNGKVKAKYKDDLKKKMLYFSNVDSIEPTEIKWSSIRFQRNNQTYRMLVSICQLMIEGMLITTDAGNYRLACAGCMKNLFWNITADIIQNCLLVHRRFRGH